MDLNKIYEVIDKFSEERDWDQFHSLKNLSMALSVEVSELVEIFQWLTEEQSNKLSEKKKQQAQEEIADIAIYLFKISKKLNINIENAILEKMKKNKLKYPVNKSKGIAEKYTDL